MNEIDNLRRKLAEAHRTICRQRAEIEALKKPDRICHIDNQPCRRSCHRSYCGAIDGITGPVTGI